MATSQDFVNWVCSDALNPHFLKYALLSETRALRMFAVGSVHPTIYFPEVKALQICMPPRPEQDQIVNVLCALDDKIEINQRMNETLETMMRTMFEAMQQEQEWREFALGDVCDIFDGPHATPRLVETGPVFLGISNLDDGRIDLRETNHVSPEDFKTWTRRVTPRAGDVVFSYETRLGQVGLIPPELTCCLGRRMGLLRAKAGKTSPSLLLTAYLSPRFQEIIRQRTVHGSTVDRLPLKDMHTFPILLPHGRDADSLAAILEPLRSKVEANDRNSRTLAATRDLLIPRLMSGEIRLKSAEKVAEAAL